MPNEHLPRLPRPADFSGLFELTHDGTRHASTFAEVNYGGSIFGGQLMAQAMLAAGSGLNEEWDFKSLHGHFLRAIKGDTLPSYTVAPVMSGRSFMVREVEAMAGSQSGFRASVMFQRAEAGPQHADAMPGVPAPEELPDLVALAEILKDRLSEENYRVFRGRQLFELRPVDGEDFMLCTERKPRMQYWIRSASALPGDARQHAAALLYLSDTWLNSTMLSPHTGTRIGRHFMAPTLSHDLWLHRPFRADDWLLFDMHSPSLHGATALILADVFDRSGQLVANVAQHALLRIGAP